MTENNERSTAIKHDKLTVAQRRRYEEMRQKLSEKHKPLVEKIRSSNRLSKEDFAILINARG